MNQKSYAGEREYADELSCRLAVVDFHRALLGERDRLARELTGRRRRRLMAATDNRLVACPDLSR